MVALHVDLADGVLEHYPEHRSTMRLPIHHVAALRRGVIRLDQTIGVLVLEGDH